MMMYIAEDAASEHAHIFSGCFYVSILPVLAVLVAKLRSAYLRVGRDNTPDFIR